jgi:phenylalanyl-tRNA synthetase alpha chain
MEFDFISLKNRIEEDLKKAIHVADLDVIERRYLGRNGEISAAFGLMKDISSEKRADFGRQLNELKKFVEEKLSEKGPLAARDSEWKAKMDITIPGKKPVLGHLHPLTITTRKAIEIFQGMGFAVAEGPEIESEFYNFDALNVPADHPARDLWDTFWLKDQKMLLRTHMSPVQVRYMERHKPPLKIIAPGRVFRYEATDASHDFEFSQIEGLMVDKKINVANFKAIIQEFFSRFFSKQVEIRLRPSFFPFTEPSFEVDINCLACGGKGCPACKKTGWLEIMGAGMVHPNVLKSCGLEPKDWQGFAFGMGWDRLTMMKYKINDIRLLRSGDLRFLNQF